MPATYSYAPEVAAIAVDLIAEHHQHLVESRIEYLMSSETPVKNGRAVWGTARVVSGLAAFFGQVYEPAVSKTTGEIGSVPEARPFFCIIISAPVWAELTSEQQTALVDHELCHFDVAEDKDGNPCLKTVGHDLEEFRAVVERHGLWTRDTRRFAEVAAPQLELALDEDRKFGATKLSISVGDRTVHATADGLRKTADAIAARARA